MPRAAKQVLNIADNETVRRTRELMLEKAGFAVVSVSNARDTEHVCRRGVFDLAILGHEYTPEQKQRLATVLRSLRIPIPILELCRMSPEVGAEYTLIAPGPEELVEEVKRILNGGKHVVGKRKLGN